jgi:hypothetical protein
MTDMSGAAIAVIHGEKAYWWWGLLFTVGGGVFTLAGLWHLMGWWKRIFWRRASGTVVRLVEFSAYDRIYSPEIRYLHEGTEHLFVSKYGDNSPPKLGDSVKIRVHPSGTRAERNVFLHQVFLGWFSLAMGILFVCLGISSMRNPPADPERGDETVPLQTTR